MSPIKWCSKTRRVVELTESENEKIVEKIFESWNQHDTEAWMSLLSDDYKFVGQRTTHGKEGERKGLDFLAFPDSKFRIERMVSQGNTTVVEYTMTGTNTGDWPEARATNKKIDHRILSIFEFEAGKARAQVKLWSPYFDQTKRLEQLFEDIYKEVQDKIRQK